MSEHLGSVDYYEQLTEKWLGTGNLNDYLGQLASEFHEKAAALGLKPEKTGFPEGTYDLHYLWFFVRSGDSATATRILAHVFPDKVVFTAGDDGEVAEDAEIPVEQHELVFGLWSEMNAVLFALARSQIIGDGN